MLMEKIKVYTPLKAIRLKCLDCSCDNYAEVRECPRKTCTLYPYRMGHRPKGEEFIDNKESD
jgi:hypothetical protein